MLRFVVEYIVTPVGHIFNLSLEDGVPSDMEKGAKVIQLPKNSSTLLMVQPADQSVCLEVLSKLLEKIV